MPALKSCPPVETLSDFLLGKLDAAARESIAGHVSGCHTCLSRLSEADRSFDSLVHGLRQPPVDDEFMREPECQLAVQRSQRLGYELDNRSEILRDYELVDKLGEGGMGTVYRARHKKLDKWVALKVLPRQRLHSPEAVSRFEREMRAIGRLHHPNIVLAHDAGETDGQHYLVMELVEGMNLATLVRRIGPLSIADVCEIVRQVALGLQRAHESNLVHRDIKPSNVMLTHGGEVKILDLGLARLEEPLAGGHDVTSEGQIMGTLNYMAPEQLGDSHAVDQRADIYSLGATLYNLLTGNAPYADEKYNTPQKKLMAIATKPIESAGDLRDGIPPQLLHVLDRMLAKNPDERFDRAGEIAEVLTEFTADADLPTLYTQASQATDHAADTKRPVKSTFDPVASSFTDTDVIRTGATPQTTSSPQFMRRMPRKPPWIVVIAPSLLCALAAGTVFIVSIGKATLVVHVDDEHVTVELRKHGLVVRNTETQRAYTISVAGEKRFPPGSYAIEPGGQLMVIDDAGMKVKTDVFTLARRGREVVKITLQDRPPQRDTPYPEDEQKRAQSLPAMSDMALVTRPAAIGGVKSWSVETVVPRSQLSQRRETIVMSPDGKLFALAALDGVLRIYDVSTGELVHAWMGHEEGILGVDWSHNQRHLATFSGKVVGAEGPYMEVCVWNFPAGKLLKRFRIECWSSAPSLAWSPKHSTLAIGAHGLFVWSTESPETNPSRVLSGYRIASLSWSPDGDLLSFACDRADENRRKIYLWDPHVNRLRHFETPSAISTGVLLWSPDGRTLLTGNWDKQVRLWDVRTGDLIQTLGANCFSGMGRLAWSSNGQTVALHVDMRKIAEPDSYDSRAYNVVRFFNLEEGKWSEQTITLRDMFAEISSIVWVPNSSTLIVANTHGRVRLYDSVSGRLKLEKSPIYLSSTELPRQKNQVLLSVNQSDAGDRLFSLWDFAMGEKWRAEVTGPLSRYVQSPDGRLVAACSRNRIAVYRDGKVVETRSMPARVKAAAWGTNKRLAIGIEKTVYVWDLLTGMTREISGHSGDVFALACSPNSTVLAVSTTDGDLFLWSLENASQLPDQPIKAHADGFYLTFSPDGDRLATKSHDGKDMAIWDVNLADGETNSPQTWEIDVCSGGVSRVQTTSG